MNRYIYILVAMLTLFRGYSNAQTTELKPLTIGDKMPDVFLKKILNSTQGNGTLSSLTKGRYVILDMFATWCVPCVKALPEYQKLQVKFNDKLVIIPVAYESANILSDFISKHREINRTLSFVVEDVEIHKLFPHRSVPHQVWIDKSGVIKAITTGNYLNEIRLAQFTSGAPFNLPLKQDDFTLDKSKHLLINNNGGADTSFIYRSILSKYQPGGGSETNFKRKIGTINRVTSVNGFPLNLFIMAYSNLKLYGINKTRVELNVRDSTAFYMPKNKEETKDWLEKYFYCYELSYDKYIPDTVFFASMYNDLNRFFDYKGSTQKREVSCLIMYRVDKNDSLLLSRTAKLSPVYTGKMRNQPISSLVEYINNLKDIEPVIDETGFTANADMDLDFIGKLERLKYPDIEVIRATLKRYGLDLKWENRIVDILVIEDKTKVAKN